MPHWRLEGAVYFVTWRLAAIQPQLTPFERDLVVNALQHFDGKRYTLYCYVVMPDHVHVIVAPQPGQALSKIMHSWKSFTAHSLVKAQGRRAPVWQSEYLDRILRSEEELLEKAEYILANPHRCWPATADYPWVGWLRSEG